MSFSDYYVTHRTRKGNFLMQIDELIDWEPIEETIVQHYSPASDVTGRPAYSGLLLFKMLLVGIWHNGLSDEAVEEAVVAVEAIEAALDEVADEDEQEDELIVSEWPDPAESGG